MSDTYDPDERFSLHPLTGEEVLRTLLGVEDDEEPDPDLDDEPAPPT